MSNTGATPEQIEAAKARMRAAGYSPGHPVEMVLEVYAPVLVPSDQRIVDERDVLTPEARAAIGRFCELFARSPLAQIAAREWGLSASDLALLAALAEGGRE